MCKFGYVARAIILLPTIISTVLTYALAALLFLFPLKPIAKLACFSMYITDVLLFIVNHGFITRGIQKDIKARIYLTNGH